MTLRIVSWNMWCFNSDHKAALSFISSLEFDVLCLQEVPHTLLPDLKALPYHFSEAIDFEWLTDFKGTSSHTDTCHLLIVSKYPLDSVRTYEADVSVQKGLVAQSFRWFMHIVNNWAGPTVRRQILSADVHTDTQIIRVFCGHPPLVNATVRAKEIAYITKRLATETPNIICGDFNILDFWAMKPLNLLIGSSLSQAMPWFDERSRIEKEFSEAGLLNPLRGNSTHDIARSQLDHILVSASAEILEKQVITSTYGSDHHPVAVTVEI